MARKPRAIVFDSWAIMPYLGGEPSAERVADTMADAHEEDIPLLMTVVDAGEVWYILAREVSVAEADSSIRQIEATGNQVRRRQIGALRMKRRVLNRSTKCLLLIASLRRWLKRGKPSY